MCRRFTLSLRTSWIIRWNKLATIAHIPVFVTYIGCWSSRCTGSVWRDSRQRSSLHCRIRRITSQWCCHSRPLSHVRDVQRNEGNPPVRHCEWLHVVPLRRTGWRCDWSHLGILHGTRYALYGSCSCYRAHFRFCYGLPSLFVSVGWTFDSIIIISRKN